MAPRMNVRQLHLCLLASLAAVFALGLQTAANATTPQGCTPTPLSSLTVNVRDKGAKGDGKTNDTAAIQDAIDAVSGTGGTVFVPNGTYMVQGTTNRRLRLGRKMVLRLADGATLKVIPNAEKAYSILRIRDVNDVAVIGGTLVGDRAQHQSTEGQWGMGIYIGPRVKRVSVVGVTAKEMWGDGFYVGGGEHIALCSVSSIHNRRQGLSIIAGKHLLVWNSLFAETRGTRPSAGIDIEPDFAKQRVANVRIERSTFRNNAGGGIMVSGKKAIIERVEIRNNVFEGNRPILIENAPRIQSTKICDNRAISQQKPAAAHGFNTFAEPVDVVALQMNCDEGQDMRFEKNRVTKKKP